MKKVYICSKYRGNTKLNVDRAKEYCKYAVSKGYIPICPHIYFTQFMDDNNEIDRTTAFEMNKELLKSCDELWICHCGVEQVSEGMSREIQLADSYGMLTKIFVFN